MPIPLQSHPPGSASCWPRGEAAAASVTRSSGDGRLISSQMAMTPSHLQLCVLIISLCSRPPGQVWSGLSILFSTHPSLPQ